ncbi:hypothetical protein AAG906_040928 [Vitis piasezkii]
MKGSTEQLMTAVSFKVEYIHSQSRELPVIRIAKLWVCGRVLVYYLAMVWHAPLKVVLLDEIADCDWGLVRRESATACIDLTYSKISNNPLLPSYRVLSLNASTSSTQAVTPIDFAFTWHLDAESTFFSLGWFQFSTVPQILQSSKLQLRGADSHVKLQDLIPHGCYKFGLQVTDQCKLIRSGASGRTLAPPSSTDQQKCIPINHQRLVVRYQKNRMQQGVRFQQQRSNDSNNHVSGTQLLVKPCIDSPQLLDDPHIMFKEGHTLHLREWHSANDSNNHVSGTQLLLKPRIDFPQLLDDPHIMFKEGHTLQPREWHSENDSINHVSGPQLLLKPRIEFPQLLDEPPIMFKEGHTLQSGGWHVNSSHQNGWHHSEKLPINSNNDFVVMHRFHEVHVPVRTRVVQVVKYEHHTSANNCHHQQVCNTENRGYQKGPWLMKGLEEEISDVIKVFIKN